MPTVDEWKARLRARLKAALAARDRPAAAAVRETLAAIENAEAPPARAAPTFEGGAFAGSVAGLGAGEVQRLDLSPAVVAALVAHELQERLAAAAEYRRLGRPREAEVLAAQAEVLAALVEEPPGPAR